MISAFTKMDGTGNDFVVLDARTQPIADILPIEILQNISNRQNKTTKGCDQIIIIRPDSAADAFMQIFNSDGSEVSACGNATRCVGRVLIDETGKNEVSINTAATKNSAPLFARLFTDSSDDGIEVDMGEPNLNWKDIPLTEELDILNLPISEGNLSNPTAISMGNPHMVFFVDDVDSIDFEKNSLGTKLENHPLYPEKANVGVAQIIDNTHIKLRVFERGAGETFACGTGACAAAVAGNLRGLTKRNVKVSLNGGDLFINWRNNNHVLMSGAVNTQFTGTLDLSANS